jgi:phage baseplate assembly protein W
MAIDELARDFLGTGWAFPIQLMPETGLVERVSYEEDIKQSICIILSTAKGERVMRRAFGCGIHDLVFAAVSTQLITQVKGEVEEALRVYEARIDVLRVEVSTERLSMGHLLISIDYRVRSTNQPGNYVYPFYFREA